MQFQFDVSTTSLPKAIPPAGPEAVPELLRQILETQRDYLHRLLQIQEETLAHARMVHQENMNRWRTMVGRWAKEYPDLAIQCKQIYPVMEKAYFGMVQTLAEDAVEQGEEGFESDFSLQEFIDRHGQRLGQLGHMLGVVGPVAECAPVNPNPTET